MHQPYADMSFYKEYTGKAELVEDSLPKYLKKASRDIDALTFNRIVKKGFANLTEYQKEIIQEVCCEHASFLCDNETMLKTYLSSYSINGVSMNFGSSWNLHVEGGVAMDKSLYEKLSSTGLCSLSFYYG